MKIMSIFGKNKRKDIAIRARKSLEANPERNRRNNSKKGMTRKEAVKAFKNAELKALFSYDSRETADGIVDSFGTLF